MQIGKATAKKTLALLCVLMPFSSSIAHAQKKLPPSSKPELGIASHYRLDRKIDSDPDVHSFTSFQGKKWKKTFYTHPTGNTIFTLTRKKKALSFEPFFGSAVAMKVEKGSHYGGSLEYLFAKHHKGREPEAMHFRYYLRFDADWDGTGGKLPGFGGTYGVAGWGGKPSDGRNGWSARGSFKSPQGDRIPIGSYCYHSEMKGQYGDVWGWKKKKLGYLERDRWYCIEQYLQLNTPNVNDGIIRGWV